MKGLLLSVLISAAHAPGQPVTTVAPQRLSAVTIPSVAWVFNGQSDNQNDNKRDNQGGASCELFTDGEVMGLGATLDLQCAAGTQLAGNLQASVPAQGWRQRRITISAEISVADAAHASLWLKTRAQNKTLMYDDATEQDMLDATTTEDGWVRRVITLPVAADATHITFGVMLQGGHAAALRDVQMTVSAPGMIAPEATRLLDSVIDIVKQNNPRNDLAWQVLEPQLRLFASGAQTSSEVYPAIKYLLWRLGDRQSLLLTPEVAAALRRFGSDGAENSSSVNVFSLADGACLVLSRPAAVEQLRTARNLVPAASLQSLP